MIIDSVEIKGFWGTKKASAIINQDVTIFIGYNGTGKTTFVNLIAAALSLDIIQLSSLQFEEIKIKLIDPNQKRSKTIKVLNNSEESIPFNLYQYKISNKTYQVFADPRIIFRSSRYSFDKLDQYRRMPSRYREEYIQLKKELSRLVEISQISVYRQSYDVDFEGDPRQRFSAVDDRLQQLFERFAKYQLKLETRLNEISKRFQQQVVLSLLYNEEFDSLKTDKFKEKINLEEQSYKLSLAFKELGIEGKNDHVKRHIKRMEEGIKSWGNYSSSQDKQIDIENVFVLPLIYRTNYIIDLLNQSENEKNKIIEFRQKFFDILQSFIAKKKFVYDNKTSELFFSLDEEGKDSLPWMRLSSGEKQLLIQFLEVLLQENRSVIFIADEPELSLHLTWQEKLLKSIRDLNQNAQLIVATHSPDIVADFRNRVLNMEDVVS